jgi:hypothetical protein
MKNPMKSLALILAAIAFALIPVSCTEKEDGHDHDHDHADHGDEGHKEGDDHAHAEGEEGHDHDHEGIEDGPNGGRLLTGVEPHLEFFVTEDRKVQISSVTDDEKLQPIGEQVVKVIGGDRANPTRMKFEKKGDVLISDIAFPEGNDFPIVVQIKNTPDSETVTDKFNLNLMQCPECPNKEYACTCDHEH